MRAFAVRFVDLRLAALALLAIGCSTSSDKAPASSAGAPSTPDSTAAAAAAAACPGGRAELTLPAGFCATVFAEGIERARHVTVASNGDVYTTIDGTGRPDPTRPAPAPVSFVALRDTNHDGKADIIARVGALGNTGIGLFGGYLYVDEGTRVVRYSRPDTQLVPSAAAEVVVDRLPLAPGHRARNFAIGSDSALYLNVGSATNSCQTKDRVNDSPGVDPCTELLTRAGIWKFSATKRNQHFGTSSRFATGIRNGMGIAIAADGRLYATQHGRDQLHDNWPTTFPDAKYQAENPAEQLMQVNKGDDFGWPYCYYAVDEKKLVNAPEYGGDGKKAERCSSRKAPLAAFPGHWAPMSLLFYTGSTFPAKYRNGAFIAFHGSWNRAPEQQAGYRVVFQPLADGAIGGAYETFADGFAGLPPAEIQPGTAKHRPMGLATAPDGAMIITDDKGGRIYRVTYGAGR